MKDTCSERIKEALEKRAMTQADLVRSTGINKATMSQYISGKYLPKQDKLEKIAEALRVDPAWLMGFNAFKAKGDINTEILEYLEKLNFEGQEKVLEYVQLLYTSGTFRREGPAND